MDLTSVWPLYARSFICALVEQWARVSNQVHERSMAFMRAQVLVFMLAVPGLNYLDKILTNDFEFVCNVTD